jgi:hypothetical protein
MAMPERRDLPVGRQCEDGRESRLARAERQLSAMQPCDELLIMESRTYIGDVGFAGNGSL